MRPAWLAGVLGVAGAAHAGDLCPDVDGPSSPFRHWSCVERAKVLEAVDPDPDAAVARYAQLVHNELPSGDPALGEALVWLARARWVTGDVAGARDALDRCIRSGLEKARCVELRATLDLYEEGVHELPVRWTFGSPDHGVFHPRPFWDKGALRLVSEDGQDWLSWATTVDPMQGDRLQGDQLVVGFRDPTPAPRRVLLRLRADEIPALVEVELVDTLGHAYSAPAGRVELPLRQWVTLDVALADAVPVSPGAPPLDPARLYRLVLHDVTTLTGRAGRNEIRLDELVIE